jgi:predicted phage tail protein
VALSWAPSAGAASYRVRAGNASQTNNAFDANVGNVTSVTAQNVPPGTYFVRVHAVGPFGESGPSDEVTVIVATGSCALPAPPTLAAAAAGATVALNWSSAPGLTGYLLDAGSRSGGVEFGTFSFGAGANSFTADGVPRGTYFLRVRAVNLCGAGSPSTEIRVDVP